jgi:galactofuranosylgalactofuranosylrhamnosyl-N-acetylglucosaminyl-diphospho-decaprenol beta-1,5/1,6-galactofuranosyltransferase
MPKHTIFRTVLPQDDVELVLPLYVETTARRKATGGEPVSAVEGRRQLRVPAGGRLSLASYFNAFPAAYWQRWTTVHTVMLEVTTSGPGAIHLQRSDSVGTTASVNSTSVTDVTVTLFELELSGFDEGGWYWFDLEAGSAPLLLTEANWRVQSEPECAGKASIAITTLNRPGYCLDVLQALGKDPEVAERLDRIFVIDQGKQKVRDQPGFAAVEALHGDRLVVIDQENLGGSGGFSRGMLEMLDRADSDFVILLDDDIILDPEAVFRAVRFAQYCTDPTIVGGHMLDLNNRRVLHALGELVHPRSFNWGPPDARFSRHDFGEESLKDTPWLHSRVDVDFNGWWMCLLPKSVVKEIGLSLPLFIKWDDAEYGLRAKARGIATVSLPGAAVWHVAWTDKDDSRDWQSYFHSRNRLIGALLHSRHAFGGTVLLDGLVLDLKHLLFMHYYAVHLRQAALQDVLDGPGVLHGALRSKLGWVRNEAARFGETQTIPWTDVVEVSEQKPHLTDKPSGIRALGWLISSVARHLLPVKSSTSAQLPVAMSREDARWWRVPRYDNVLVPAADGTGRAHFRRDAKQFRSGLIRSIRLHLKIAIRWRALRSEYRVAAPELASVQRWSQTIGVESKQPES